MTIRNYSFTESERRSAGRIIRLMIFFILILSLDAIVHGPALIAVLSFFATQTIGVYGLIWSSRLLIRRERRNR